jgi:protein TonB
MFEDALLESSSRQVGRRRGVPYLVSLLAESLLVGTLIVAPLVYTQALPRQFLIGALHVVAPAGRPSPRPFASHSNMAPRPISVGPAITIPHFDTPIVQGQLPPEASPAIGVPGVPEGFGNGSGPLLPDNALDKEPPPPPAPSATPATPPPTLLRLSRGVVAAKAIYQPKPDYPPLAVMAHIQGTVVLEAIIGKDGTVQNLRVVSGHPLLVQAAINAVRNWRYQPTLLSSEPVDVVTEIDVRFSLGE